MGKSKAGTRQPQNGDRLLKCTETLVSGGCISAKLIGTKFDPKLEIVASSATNKKLKAKLEASEARSFISQLVEMMQMGGSIAASGVYAGPYWKPALEEMLYDLLRQFPAMVIVEALGEVMLAECTACKDVTTAKLADMSTIGREGAKTIGFTLKTLGTGGQSVLKESFNTTADCDIAAEEIPADSAQEDIID